MLQEYFFETVNRGLNRYGYLDIHSWDSDICKM
jgi:hypothetical protein